MPTQRPPTPQEAEWYKSQGIDPSTVTLTIEDGESSTKSYTTTGAVTKSLQQKAGGLIGGGGGALAASWLLGPEVGLPVSIGAGVLGALGGGAVGQLAQEKLEGEETANRLRVEAAQAQSEHPVATGFGDIAAAALLSGGSFSPGTALRGVRGAISPLAGRAISEVDKAALKNVAIQSAVMPAINAGIERVSTGEWPSIGSLATQAAGGALFAKPSFLGRLGHRPEVKSTDSTETTAKLPVEEPVSKPILSPYKITGEDNKPVISDSDIKSLWLKIHPKPTATEGIDPLLDTEYYKAKKIWTEQSKNVEGMREWAHDEFMRQQEILKAGNPVKPVTLKMETTEPLKKVEPETSSPNTVPVPEASKNVDELRRQNELSNQALATSIKQEQLAEMQKEQLPVERPVANQLPIELTPEQIKANLEKANVPKPLNENALNILNPEGLIGSAVNRPEKVEVPLPPLREAKEVSDIDRFQELQTEYKRLLDARAYDSPEFHKVWREMEDIKNKNGGMPPTSREARTSLGRLPTNEGITTAGKYKSSGDFLIDHNEDGTVNVTHKPTGETIAKNTDYDRAQDAITRLVAQSSAGKHIGTVASELSRIGKQKTRHGDLARGLTIDKDSASVPLIVSYDKTTGNNMNTHYNWHDDVIYVKPEHEGHNPTILHEIAHAATIKKLPSEMLDLTGNNLKKYINEYIKTGTDENVKEIFKCYLETAKQLGIERHLFSVDVAGRPQLGEQIAKLRGQGYYASDIPEYLAGFFNDAKWRETLNKLDSGLGDKQNLFSRLHDAISKLLGEDVRQGSMLDRILKPTEELLKQERPNATTTRQLTEDNQLEHIRANEGQRSSENTEEIREGKGEETSGRYSNEQGKERLIARRFIEDSKEPGIQFLLTKDPLTDKVRTTEYERVAPLGEWEAQGHMLHDSEKNAVAYINKPNRVTRDSGPVSFKELSYNDPRNRFAKEDSIPESVKKTGVSFAPFLTARIDRVAVKHNDPVGHAVAENMHKFAGEYDILKGEFGNSIIPIIDKSRLSQEQITKVYKHNHDISNFGTSDIKLTSQEKALSDAVKLHYRHIGERVQKEGPKIRLKSGNLRTMKLKEEGHIPPVLSQEVPYEWAENPNSDKSKQFDKLFIDHNVKQGMPAEEAMTTLRDYKSALGNQVDRSIAFNAIRKAEGNGLPWELLDQNLTSANLRYADRVARDVAYFKHLQSKPEMRKALDLVDESGNRMPPDALPEINSIRSSAETQAAMRSVLGIDIPRNPGFNAAARAGGNTVMGVGTAARNILTIPGIAATYMQGKQLGFMVKAITHMSDSRVRALESNAVRPNFQEAFDAAGYRIDEPNPIIRRLNKYSTFMRKYQGRDLSDKFEGEYLYSLGELLATDNIARAQKGNLESRHFLQRFGDLVDGGPAKLFKGEVSPKDVQRIAKRFVDATRGTYSAEGLPSWAIEGELAPFAALSKFSIEKSNTIWKDVVEPMKKGVYGPFLRYALGSLGVGVMIEQLNELLSNKRGPDMTVNEAIDGLTPEVGVSKAISLLQLASFAGIVADGAKAALQMYQGKELRYNQPLSLPLYTLVTDTLMGNMSDAAEAIREGEDPFQVMGLLATTIAGQSVQTMRYVDANFIHPEETKRKEKFRDVSVFQQMEGNRAGPAIRSNPFTDIETKKFKRTGDVEEAMKMLPELIQDAFEKSKNDPYELQRLLKGLKMNSYQTMPSFETMPASFLKYIQRLKNTQGEEAATNRLNDYMRQKMVNQVKASVIP